MIKRQHLQCPLFIIGILVTLSLLFLLSFMIWQPLANLIGFDWTELNQNTSANDANNDGEIKCDDEYYSHKVKNGKLIFGVSFGWAITSFISTFFLFVMILFALGNFLTKSQAIDMNLSYRNRLNGARVGALTDQYDNFFTFRVAAAMYILFCISIIGVIVHLGTISSMLKTYRNCEGTTDNNLIGFIVLDVLIILFMIISLVCLMRIVHMQHKYLEENHEDIEATPHDYDRSGNQVIPNPPSMPYSRRIKYQKQSGFKNFQSNRYQKQNYENNDLQSSERLNTQIKEENQQLESSRRNNNHKQINTNKIVREQFPKQNSENITQMKQSMSLKQSIPLQSRTFLKRDQKLSKNTNKPQNKWVAANKQAMNNSQFSKRPIPNLLNWDQEADQADKISHIDIYSQLQEDSQKPIKKKSSKETSGPRRRRRNDQKSVQKIGYTQYLKSHRR